LLAHLLNKICESEASRDEITAAAEFCGFRFLAELLDYCESPLLETAGWEDRWRQLIAQIDMQSK
jgi:hypothetical protein